MSMSLNFSAPVWCKIRRTKNRTENVVFVERARRQRRHGGRYQSVSILVAHSRRELRTANEISLCIKYFIAFDISKNETLPTIKIMITMLKNGKTELKKWTTKKFRSNSISRDVAARLVYGHVCTIKFSKNLFHISYRKIIRWLGIRGHITFSEHGK